jgi:Uma2 family endonuclease
MPTVIAEDLTLEIPERVTSLPAFLSWAASPEFPERGKIWWLRGQVWADMTMEQLDTHNKVKGEIFRVLANLVDETELGDMHVDGARLSNASANLSGEPDAMFVSYESLEEGRVTRIAGSEDGFTYIEGAPDMALEVVSDSSARKDHLTLREDYFRAGITEYWLVDAREEPLQFEILKRGPKGYVNTRPQSGWVKSTVFGKSFRLTPAKDKLGNAKYRLEVK